MAYVYWVRNNTTGLKYIGARYAKGCTPSDFWTTYFTSSPRVRKLIDLYGKEDFKYKILKTFDTPYEALTYENSMIRLALKKEGYVNLHPNFIGARDIDTFDIQQENQRKVASLTGTLCVLNGTGIFSLSEDEKRQVCSMGGFAASEVNRLNGTAIFDPEVRKRQHATLRERKVSAYYDPELRKELSSMGGKNGLFSSAYAERNGLSEDQMKELQRERGRKGGSKNKGFKWYNNGLSAFKYTTKMQLELSFEDFLKEHPQFKPGRKL